MIVNSPPSAVTHFLEDKLWELSITSRLQLLPDMFEYSHYLFAGWNMGITGRSCMLITSES